MKLLKYLFNVIASLITTRVMYQEVYEFMNNYSPTDIGILAGWFVLLSFAIIFFAMIFANFEDLWKEFQN